MSTTARAVPGAGLPPMRHPLVAAVVAALVALAVSAVLAVAAGASLTEAAGALWEGMVSTPFALGSSINAAAVVLLVAIGFLVAYRAGLVNVGGEGQIALGAITATALGTQLPDGTPAPLALPVVLLGAVAGGGAWAAIAAWLAVRRGVNEVITTLLLNFVGLALLALAVHEEALLRQPVTSSETLPQSAALVDGAQLPLLGVERSPATIAVVLALICAAGTAVVLRRSATGLRLTAVGLSLPASARLGLPVARLRFFSLSAAGAFGGLAGGVLVTSTPHVLTDGISSGYGFSGLVAGLLARGSVAAAVLVAAVLGLLVSGGISLQLGAGVPASLTHVTESLLILLIAGSVRWTGPSLARARYRQKETHR